MLTLLVFLTRDHSNAICAGIEEIMPAATNLVGDDMVRTRLVTVTTTTDHLVTYSMGAPGVLGTATNGHATIKHIRTVLYTPSRNPGTTSEERGRSVATARKDTTHSPTFSSTPSPPHPVDPGDRSVLPVALPVGICLGVAVLVAMVFYTRRKISASVTAHASPKPVWDDAMGSPATGKSDVTASTTYSQSGGDRWERVQGSRKLKVINGGNDGDSGWGSV